MVKEYQIVKRYTGGWSNVASYIAFEKRLNELASVGWIVKELVSSGGCIYRALLERDKQE
jgi:hypothetical protein